MGIATFLRSAWCRRAHRTIWVPIDDETRWTDLGVSGPVMVSYHRYIRICPKCQMSWGLTN